MGVQVMSRLGDETKTEEEEGTSRGPARLWNSLDLKDRELGSPSAAMGPLVEGRGRRNACHFYLCFYFGTILLIADLFLHLCL